MKKSPRVMVTLLASMGLAASAQQPPDPCGAGTFNENVCKSAIRLHGYCAPGVRVPMTYQQSYPNYYDLYQQYLVDGGVTYPSDAHGCGDRNFGLHGGFGSTGARHHAGS